MKFHFVPPELRRLDALRSDVLALSLFESERPLRGAAGLVDWRMCGRLSRLLHAGRLGGASAEVTLLPPRPRLPFDKLLLVGLGRESDFGEETFVDAIERTFGALSSMRTHSSVLALPGRATGRISPERAMQLFVDLSAAHDDQDEVTLIEDTESQKLMAPFVDPYRKRA
jgi:cytosol aminopeptidase family protein